LDGDTAMPSTFLAMRSSTTWTCSSPPPCSPGPVNRQTTSPPSSFSAFWQPRWAWSKNGLLRFFGTTAKVYFGAALVDAASNTMTPVAIAPITRAVLVRYFSTGFPPLFPDLPERARSRLLELGAPPPADLFEQDRENDEDADEGALPIGIDAFHEQAVADDLDQRRADNGAIGAALAAHQVGAADHGRGDDPQLVGLAQAIDRGALPADDQYRAHGGGKGGDDIGLQLDAVDRHARQPRRLLVTADGVKMAAPGRELEH